MRKKKIEQRLQGVLDEMQERAKFAEQLMADDPKLPFYSALTIAGDIRSAERSKRFLNEGMPFDQAQVFVGSYARLQFWVDCLNDGKISEDQFFSELPELWRGTDPDDSKPEYLDLWKRAAARNKGYVRDGRPLPRGKFVRVYRGQDETNQYGIAWTTDPKIAEKFARGAATRQANRGGVVYTGKVRRDRILAYLTGRGESEVIVDPAYILPATKGK